VGTGGKSNLRVGIKWVSGSAQRGGNEMQALFPIPLQARQLRGMMVVEVVV